MTKILISKTANNVESPFTKGRSVGVNILLWMDGGLTRAQRSLQISWYKTRHRGREVVRCESSRFIQEMQSPEDKLSSENVEVLTPKQRIANLKALLYGDK